MAIRFIEAGEDLEIVSLPMLIFGPPGAWKTHLFQTAREPFTMDFDDGLHRVAKTYRKRGARFETWQDVTQLENHPGYQACLTVGVDTGGRVLDLMTPQIRAESPKNCSPGGLSPQGWGVLGSRFGTWLKLVLSHRKDVVVLCHQSDSDGEVRPDFAGNMAWKEIHKRFDMIGRIRYEGQARVLDFNPCEGAMACKNAGGLPPTKLPDLRLPENHLFLGKLIDQAKANINGLSAAHEATAKTVDAFEAWLKLKPPLDAFNNGLKTDLSAMAGGAKRLCWHLAQSYAAEQKWVLDAATKEFKGGAA